MHWIITVDHIQTSRVGYACAPVAWIAERRAADRQQRQAMNKAFAESMNFEFRLFDDDGGLYYEGACLDLDQQDETNAFAPLDWAREDVGCTWMEYRRKGETIWKPL